MKNGFVARNNIGIAVAWSRDIGNVEETVMLYGEMTGDHSARVYTEQYLEMPEFRVDVLLTA